MHRRIIIFSDLDGTLLDSKTYLFEPAEQALSEVRRRSIPLVFCSAKTRAEIEFHRNQLDIKAPFISENGSAIFIPQGYFSFEYDFDKTLDNYNVIEFGISYATIRQSLSIIRKNNDLTFSGFADMDVAEVVRLTGLNEQAARRAMSREYDEALKISMTDNEIALFKNLVQKHKLRWSHGGTFFHVLGNSDKGKAVTHLSDLFRKEFGDIHAVGLGDSYNDLPLLASVDTAILVRKDNKTWEAIEAVNLPNVLKTDGIGPAGWNESVMKIIADK